MSGKREGNVNNISIIDLFTFPLCPC